MSNTEGHATQCQFDARLLARHRRRLQAGKTRDRRHHHTGEKLHGGDIIAVKRMGRGRQHLENTQRTPEVAQRSDQDGTRAPNRRQLAQSTRGFDSASWQSSTSPVRTHSAESPLSVCRRTPISGAVRPVRARQIISLPRRSAMAAPVAPVKVCAFSAMMLMPGSRSISLASINVCGAERGP